MDKQVCKQFSIGAEKEVAVQTRLQEIQGVFAYAVDFVNPNTGEVKGLELHVEPGKFSEDQFVVMPNFVHEEFKSRGILVKAGQEIKAAWNNGFNMAVKEGGKWVKIWPAHR